MEAFSKNKLFALGLLAVCGACHKETQHPAISQPISLHQPLDEAFTSYQFCKGDWPSRQWWGFFQDSQLNFLIEKGLRENPSLKMAQAKWISTLEYAKVVKSKLYPQLNGNYVEDWTYFGKNGFVLGFYPLPPTLSPPKSANIIDLSLNFSYEFDFWGKNKQRYQAALGIAMMELAESIQAELILSTMIAYAYFEYQTHQTLLCLEKQIYNNYQSISSLLQKRVSTGIDNAFPELNIEKKLFETSQQIIEIEKSVEIDLVVLKNLVGNGPDSFLELEPVPLFSEKPLPVPENVGLDLLGRRPDLIAMIWQAEAASKEIKVAKTEFYPNITIGANGGVESLHFNTLFSSNSLTGSLMPAISLPLFTGGRLEGNLKQKIALFNEAVYNYNNGLLEAVKEVSSAIFELKAFYAQTQVQKKVVENRLDKQNLTQERVEKGLDTQLNFYYTLIETLEENIQKAKLENFRYAALVRLIKSLGGGFETQELPELVKGGK